MSPTLIVGMGAVGGVVAAGLLRAGEAPVLATGRADLQRRIASDGLIIADETGEAVVRARAIVDAGELDASVHFEAIILATKAADTVGIAAELRTRLAPGGYFLTLQNGYIIDAVASVVGGDANVIGGVTGFTAMTTEPAVYRRTSRGALYVGEVDGTETQRVAALAERLACVAPTHVSGNISGALWSKLCLNCSITALAGVTGLPLASLLDSSLGRRVFLSALHEVVRTAALKHVRLEPLAVPPEMLIVDPAPGWLHSEKTERLLNSLIAAYGHGKPSVLRSLEQHRKTEIDYLTGYVSRTAGDLGVPARLNQAITELIHEIEDDELEISPENLARLAPLCADG